MGPLCFTFESGSLSILSVEQIPFDVFVPIAALASLRLIGVGCIQLDCQRDIIDSWVSSFNNNSLSSLKRWLTGEERVIIR